MYSIIAHDCKLWEDRNISTVRQIESLILWGDSTCILQEFNEEQMKYYMKLFNNLHSRIVRDFIVIGWLLLA